jgi:GT2 family glycosyltransferase
MTPKLSIIIVNYQSADKLVACLQSLQVATDQPFEVILVDNSPGDGAQIVLAESDTHGHYFSMPENVGYTRAANFGAEHAIGEYLCFVNPDMILEPHALDRLVEWVTQHPRTVAGPRERNANGAIMTTAFPSMTRRYLWGAKFVYTFPWPRSWQTGLRWLMPAFSFADQCRTAQEPFLAPVLSGACWVVARAVWQEVGGFEPALTYFGLESEWFARAKELGVVAWYIPSAEVFHEHATSIQRTDGFTVRQIADENRRWYARRKGLLALSVLLVIIWLERRLRRS